MKLFSLQNLTTHVANVTDDATLGSSPNPRPNLANKQAYNDWCRASTTKGFFISAWEGINPQGRVVAQNPGRLLHGIIADYDNANAASLLNNLPTSTSYLPTWVIDSFTPGKCRLIWPFENPVMVSNPELTEQFLKVLDEKVKISDALPGFDKSSWKDSQYFEMGTNWRKITEALPLADALLAQCMMEAGTRKPIDTGDVEIPLDVIAEEVEARWPGRWPVGTFTEGVVGPLFWIEPFVNHRSCAVAVNGMICYSDRAPSNFVPWRAILGNKFVEKYEQDKAARVAEMFWFDGGNYWTEQNSPGYWRTFSRTDAQLHLKSAGCSLRQRRGKPTNEVEEVLKYIHDHRYVNMAVPLLFEREKLVHYNGKKLLNISNKMVMQPAETGDPKDFPWLHNYFMNCFDGDQDGIPAKEFFLAWFKRFYQSSYEGDPQQGQSIVIAGEAHTGKSFMSRWVIGAALGGSCEASDFLLGNTKFNEEAAHNAVWLCDDAVAQGDLKTKQELALRLKAMAAKPTVRYEPKFVNAAELPFKGRVVVCCNVDPESLRILPTMDGTIKDKIMLFRIDPEFAPVFLPKNSENEGRVMREMPFFLRWLLDYQVDERVVDRKNTRFAVKSFHHRDLIDEANSEQPEARLAEMIAQIMKVKRGDVKPGATCRMNVTELMQAADDAQVSRHIQSLGGMRNVGKLLHKVIEQNLSPFITDRPRKINGYPTYTFNPHLHTEETYD